MPETGLIQHPRLVLASGSPRRRDLLVSIGVVPHVEAPDVDETPRPDESADALATRLAAAKSAAVEVAPNDVVLGFDTIVVIDDTILGKPVDADDARGMLRRLSGRTHEVITAVSARCGAWEASESSRAVVTFRTLSDAEIEWYVATEEPLDKAGAYAIQGAGALFVFEISGNYSGVVGLPLPVVDELLSRIGRPLLSWVPS